MTLTTNQIASHSHTATAAAYSGAGNQPAPGGHVPAAGRNFHSDTTADRTLPVNVGNTGGGQPHTNMQPWLGVNYIIALVGIFPSPD